MPKVTWLVSNRTRGGSRRGAAYAGLRRHCPPLQPAPGGGGEEAGTPARGKQQERQRDKGALSLPAGLPLPQFITSIALNLRARAEAQKSSPVLHQGHFPVHVAQAGSPGNGSKREQTGSTPQGRARWGLPRSTPKAPTILDLHRCPHPRGILGSSARDRPF